MFTAFEQWDETESTHKTVLLNIQVQWLSRGIALLQFFELISWIICIFYGIPFLLEQMTNYHQLDLSIWQSLENERSEPVTRGKTINSICCQWPNSSFQMKIRILGTCICYCKHDSLEILNDFLMKLRWN